MPRCSQGPDQAARPTTDVEDRSDHPVEECLVDLVGCGHPPPDVDLEHASVIDPEPRRGDKGLSHAAHEGLVHPFGAGVTVVVPGRDQAPRHGRHEAGKSCRWRQLGDDESVVDLVDVAKAMDQRARDTQGSKARELCGTGAARAHRDLVEQSRHGMADTDGPVPTVVGRSEHGGGGVALADRAPQQRLDGPVEIGTPDLRGVHPDHEYREWSPGPRIVDGPGEAHPEVAIALGDHVEAGTAPIPGVALERQHPVTGTAGAHGVHGVEEGGSCQRGGLAVGQRWAQPCLDRTRDRFLRHDHNLEATPVLSINEPGRRGVIATGPPCRRPPAVCL